MKRFLVKKPRYWNLEDWMTTCTVKDEIDTPPGFTWDSDPDEKHRPLDGGILLVLCFSFRVPSHAHADDEGIRAMHESRLNFFGWENEYTSVDRTRKTRVKLEYSRSSVTTPRP